MLKSGSPLTVEVHPAQQLVLTSSSRNWVLGSSLGDRYFRKVELDHGTKPAERKSELTCYSHARKAGLSPGGESNGVESHCTASFDSGSFLDFFLGPVTNSGT